MLATGSPVALNESTVPGTSTSEAELEDRLPGTVLVTVHHYNSCW